jgi:hypothetical protein
MAVLDDYFERQLDESTYSHWMRLFVSIFQLSRWLPEYVELLLGIERRNDPFSLIQLLRPRVDPVQQGGGIDAPPLDHTLGIGACFVLRELCRARMLTNPEVHPHCYMPGARVIRLLQWIGLDAGVTLVQRLEQSRLVHQFLSANLGPDGATFGGDFDIPLLVVSADPQLFEEVFEEPQPHELSELAPDEDIES